MSIPIEEIRPGWYWVTVLNPISGETPATIVRVNGEAPFMEIIFGNDRGDYSFGNLKFIQRIEPPV